MNYNSNIKKGFTLIELLVVIGILAILATVVVLVLNPAELFAQARDAQRIADLAAIQSAIGLYFATAAAPDMGDGGGPLDCGVNWGVSTVTASPTKRVAATSATPSNPGDQSTDGTGWVFANLSLTTGGSPISALPRDPVNDATNNYQYSCGNEVNGISTTFEINANMQSLRYSTGGGDDVESNTSDGGNDDNSYEIGNAPGLNL
ncbi:MAG: type II secretion system protein [Candidatus Harrisonbacteria bacterium]|nr:type II secretion system protein [Candidatus Harrisonbacteria bacterium]